MSQKELYLDTPLSTIPLPSRQKQQEIGPEYSQPGKLRLIPQPLPCCLLRSRDVDAYGRPTAEKYGKDAWKDDVESPSASVLSYPALLYVGNVLQGRT